MKLLFLLLSTLSLLFAEFTRNNAYETVHDSDANLTWQDNTVAATQRLAWQAAVEYCDGLVFANQNDWRLPDIDVLKSIADASRPDGQPNIQLAFAHAAPSGYWSSTTYASDTSNAWGVYFGNGFDYWNYKTHSYYVRCVRSGQLVNSAPTDLNISNAAIAENSAIGTSIGTLDSSDSDVGDTATYSLACNTPTGAEGNFSIAGTALKSAVMFDYETQSSYSLCVKVTDSFALSYEKHLTVTISNVSEPVMSVEIEPANILLMGATQTDVNLTKTFTIRNSGEAGSLLIVNVAPFYPSPHFTLPQPQPIVAGSEQIFEVRFASSEAGSYGMTVMLLGGTAPYPLTFSATAVEPSGSDTDLDGIDDALDLWPDDVYFGVDSDGDGLPDEWEIQNYTDLTTATVQDFALYLHQNGYLQGEIKGYSDGNQSGYDQGTQEAIEYCHDAPERCGIKPKAVVIPMF